jgi:hypothetical protein
MEIVLERVQQHSDPREKNSPFMTCITDHSNEQLPELYNEIVLIGLELPTNPFCGRGSQFKSKLLQSFGHFLVL